MNKKFYFDQSAVIIKNLGVRNIDGYYFETAGEALEEILKRIKKESLVAYGGSVTLNEIGLLDALRSRNQPIMERSKDWRTLDFDKKRDFYLSSLYCDVYLMSTNAISLDGKLVNIDYYGNRVSALMYGPKEVFVIAGMNKVVMNAERGIERVHNFASPKNSIRLHRNTPCAKKGKCYDCNSPDCICCHVVITRHSFAKNRIKVFLIGENLGF